MADTRHSGVVVDLVGEVLDRKGRVGFTVASSSMEPALRIGDRAEVEPLRAGGPGLGEMVLLRDAVLGYVVHRVIWRWPPRGEPVAIYTKGDAAPYRDPKVPRARVIGRVGAVAREGLPVREGGAGRWAAWAVSVTRMAWHAVFGGRAGRAAESPGGRRPGPGREVESRRVGRVDSPGGRS
jgi:hypothetical protein